MTNFSCQYFHVFSTHRQQKLTFSSQGFEPKNFSSVGHEVHLFGYPCVQPKCEFRHGCYINFILFSALSMLTPNQEEKYCVPMLVMLTSQFTSAVVTI